MEMDCLQKLKVLGEGTYGKCYLVRHRTTGELSVLKQIEIMGMTQAEINEAVKEAHILQSLDHPYIVGFQGSFQTTDGHLNILMGYADGGDLSHKIRQTRERQSVLPESQILDWFTQVCLAIRHVHRHKIIHRDIKAQNVFLTKDGKVKLGDFGIARPLQLTLQKIKSVVGTPYYMSPEICENKEYSYKTDVWSLGVLLLQMCLLKPPFDAQSLPALALKIAKGEFSPVPKVYSKELRKLAHDMLQVQPSKRPSVEDILRHPLTSHRVDQFLPKQIRERELSTSQTQDSSKRIVASRGLFIDCGLEESALIEQAVSPKNSSQNMQGKNYDMPVKRMDNYVKEAKFAEKEGKVGEKKGAKKGELKRREVSEPTLTPKGHAKIENERKVMVKNNSMISFQKKKGVQNVGCFKKRPKCTQDIAGELLGLHGMKDDIYQLKDQFSNCGPQSPKLPLKVEDLEETPRSQPVEQEEEEEEEETTPLQTLQSLICELTGQSNLQQLYRSCEEGDGVCGVGPCAGLVTLGWAMRTSSLGSQCV